MLHGPQKDQFDLLFRVPAVCAEMLDDGRADIGIVPSVELLRQDLEVIPGVGICCLGAVRSILLISTCPPDKIRTLAADAGSRTSVALARVLLSRRYGSEPSIVSSEPDLSAMLETADAALIIGDPALRLDPDSLPFHVLDLGREWTAMTGLPMVFAVWAGRKECIHAGVAKAFQDSLAFGLSHLDEIVPLESEPRGVTAELARRYLTVHIRFGVGTAEQKGLALFLEYAKALEGESSFLKSPNATLT